MCDYESKEYDVLTIDCETLKIHPFYLRDLSAEEQTLELCKAAFSNTYYEALEYVKVQTPELCKLAIELNPFNYRYVKEKTYELDLLAVKLQPYNLRYVENQTEEICMMAIKESGRALEYVKEQTEEMCIESIKLDSRNIQFVKNKTDKLIKLAVDDNINNISYITDPSEELINYCFSIDPNCIRFIEKLPDELVNVIIEDYSNLVSSINCGKYDKNKDKEIIIKIIQACPDSLFKIGCNEFIPFALESDPAIILKIIPGFIDFDNTKKVFLRIYDENLIRVMRHIEDKMLTKILNDTECNAHLIEYLESINYKNMM